MNPPINKYCVREVPGSHKAVILEGKISEYGISILKLFWLMRAGLNRPPTKQACFKWFKYIDFLIVHIVTLQYPLFFPLTKVFLWSHKAVVKLHYLSHPAKVVKQCFFKAESLNTLQVSPIFPLPKVFLWSRKAVVLWFESLNTLHYTTFPILPKS